MIIDNEVRTRGGHDLFLLEGVAAAGCLKCHEKINYKTLMTGSVAVCAKSGETSPIDLRPVCDGCSKEHPNWSPDEPYYSDWIQRGFYSLGDEPRLDLCNECLWEAFELLKAKRAAGG